MSKKQTLRAGPLSGVRIIEMAGIGPAPMCGMLLADLGAEILRIDRPHVAADLGIKRPLETNFILRGRQTIRVNLKRTEGVELVLALLERSDALIEGFRPGVMERLGLGPKPCLTHNPRLVYGRVTGWGQSGPRALTAGHDINYIALTGALDAMGRRGEAPPVPLNLIGDFAGGALFLAFGILAGIVRAREDGVGQVVDAAIVDGVASMLTSINGLRAAGLFSTDRGTNLLDSGAFFYDTFKCADGRYVAVGPIEKRFYTELLARLEIDPATMPDQNDQSRWDVGRLRLRGVFASRSRDEWAAVFAESDACVTPVLSLEESFVDPHLAEQGAFSRIGGFTQAAPAPHFSATPPDCPEPPASPQGSEVLEGWLDPEDIAQFRGAVVT